MALAPLRPRHSVQPIAWASTGAGDTTPSRIGEDLIACDGLSVAATELVRARLHFVTPRCVPVDVRSERGSFLVKARQQLRPERRGARHTLKNRPITRSTSHCGASPARN